MYASSLAVASKEQVEVQGTHRRVDRIAHGLAREEWQELSAGSGSKGPRLFTWARVELTAPVISGWQHWLLIRKSLDEGTKPAEMAFVLVFAPAGTSLEEMVEAFTTVGLTRNAAAVDWKTPPVLRDRLVGMRLARKGVPLGLQERM